jgi:hypothetical protein
MSKPEVTPWFHGGVKPKRKGVYQLPSGSGHQVGYQKWGGIGWGVWSSDPAIAAASRHYADAAYQDDKWRGLTKKAA